MVLKKQRTPGDIIILHLRTKYLDDMIYSSWDIECVRLKLVLMGHFFFPFYPVALPLPLTTQKIKIWENWNKHFTHVYQKSQSYDVCFLKYGAQKTDFFLIFDHFLPFYPPKNPENQNFEKIFKKRAPGDIIILHRRTINSNDMYGSSDMRCDRQNYLSSWFIFCPFTPLTTQKI